MLKKLVLLWAMLLSFSALAQYHNHPVLDTLKENGFKVKVGQNRGIPMPGQEPYRVRLKSFFDMLSQNIQEVLSRKSVIKQILISEYTSYMDLPKHLTIDLNFDAASFKKYLQQFDRLMELKTKFAFELDFGIHTFDPGMGELKKFEKRINTFFDNQELISLFTPYLKTLKLNRSPRFYSPLKEFSVDEDNILRDLNAGKKMIQGSHDFVKALYDNGIEYKFEIDIQQKLSAFNLMVSEAQKALPIIVKLHNQGRLNKINFTNYGREMFYLNGAMSLPPNNPKMISKIFEVLPTYLNMKADLGYTVEYNTYMNEKFYKVMKLVIEVYDLLKEKGDKINGIFISPTGITRFQYNSLVIAPNESVSGLKRIINSIE